VVQIHDDCPRVHWRLGVIEQMNKGADGLVCSAQLRTSTGRTNRPIAKLYSLEVTVTDTLPSRSNNLTKRQDTHTTNESTRPVCQAAVRGREQMRVWGDALRAPQRMSRIVDILSLLCLVVSYTYCCKIRVRASMLLGQYNL